MKYTKLVRDKIPEYIKKKGGTAIIHIADKNEYWQKLKEKLAEEVEEFKKDENVEELADIMEVLDAVIQHKNFDRGFIEEVRRKKAEEKGRFEKMIVLDES